MFELVRRYLPSCTLGRLHCPDGLVLSTIERPWRENQPNVSCIPEGLYTCRKFVSSKYPHETYQIMGVSGRTYILFHAANAAFELQGCIAPGMSTNWKTMRVRDSRIACDKLMQSIGGVETFQLLITHYTPSYNTDLEEAA